MMIVYHILPLHAKSAGVYWSWGHVPPRHSPLAGICEDAGLHLLAGKSLTSWRNLSCVAIDCTIYHGRVAAKRAWRRKFDYAAEGAAPAEWKMQI